MDSQDLEQLLQHFNEKITMIGELIPLVKLCNTRKGNVTSYPPFGRKIELSHETEEELADKEMPLPDLAAMTEMILEMRSMISEMNRLLVVQDKKLDQQRDRCYLRIGGLREHLKYLEKNMPQFFLKQTIEPAKETKKTLVGSKLATKPAASSNGCKSAVKANPSKTAVSSQQATKLQTAKKVAKPNSRPNSRLDTETVQAERKVAQEKLAISRVPSVDFLTTDEFETIPAYMRGPRMTYEAINRSVGDFNRAVSAKYRLLSAPQSKLSEKEVKQYQVYKGQENAETNGVFFCTIADLKQLSELKADNTTKIVLTCLRHCKRIKEIRGPAKIIRYAIVKSSNHNEN
ncbi:Spindle and kinetochore-associated protein 1 [Halotydeus destructor]|nr:Spindle and kinetochore-associated protein 1 [Halotydeus destructor]